MNYRQSNRLEGIALAGIFQTKFFCRCPNCKKLLDTRNGMPRCCPGCGIRLEGY